MANEKERVDSYLRTINRIEPEITPIDADAAYASLAVSAKRIADSLEHLEGIAKFFKEAFEEAIKKESEEK